MWCAAMVSRIAQITVSAARQRQRMRKDTAFGFCVTQTIYLLNEDLQSSAAVILLAQAKMSDLVNLSSWSRKVRTISQHSSCMEGPRKSTASSGGVCKSSGTAPDEVLALQNENCHLQLMLSEKGSEVELLKSKVGQLQQRLDELLLSNNSAMTGNVPLSDLYLKPDEDEVMTHFSGSPYRGSRPFSHSTKHSAVSVTSNSRHMSYLFVSRQLVPYMREAISIFERSDLFSGQALKARRAFVKAIDGALSAVPQFDDLVDVLDELTILQRNAIVCLNRELEYKKVSQQLEYLATIFRDPKECGLRTEDYVEHLRKQLIEVITNIHSTMPLLDPACYSSVPTENTTSDPLRHDATDVTPSESLLPDDTDRSPPMMPHQQCENTPAPRTPHPTFRTMLPIAAHRTAPSALPELFKRTRPPKLAGTHTSPQLRRGPSASNNYVQALSDLKLTMPARRTPKEPLEFIPIGFDGRLSGAQTPSRLTSPRKLGKVVLTPLTWSRDGCDDYVSGDPLEQFYAERVSGTDLEDTRTTITGFNSI
ncbi:ADL029Wp [Eremothecium gossypii ATCC 10895]|uniref:ADL029Wp n=1 Tax=Eremothecium gossypii (strain ATCC 10895 / CBS 109.51 / FGSC 9923 / NRRL Y-1056) TaxID=284811 RepID=Q75AE6_EREGS|nr:ADL029Wp [Eremothecium gossypii ATCC 10895]AAS51892.1 ADL029Wp [Eremothecium gossypii ATCC 10895]